MPAGLYMKYFSHWYHRCVIGHTHHNLLVTDGMLLIIAIVNS